MPKGGGRYSWDTRPSATGAPSRLKVATCQTAVTHDIAANLASMLDLIRQVAPTRLVRFSWRRPHTTPVARTGRTAPPAIASAIIPTL